MIADLYFEDEIKEFEVMDILQNGEQEVFDLKASPLDLIVLPNNQILVTNHSCLSIYDQNLHLVKVINRIEDRNSRTEEFRPLATTLNMECKSFYITNYQQILMTDLEFNFIKSIGSFGNGCEQFNGPYDLCFINQNLYVCDYFNKRIKVYTNQLEYVISYDLSCFPWKMKRFRSIVFIQSVNGIYCFKLEDFSLIKYFQQSHFRMSQVFSNIFQFDYHNKKLVCYDYEGDLKEEVNFTNENLIETRDGALLEFNGSLLMTSFSNKKIIKFSKIRKV